MKEKFVAKIRSDLFKPLNISFDRTLPYSGGTSAEMGREMRTRCTPAVQCLLGTNGVRVQSVWRALSTKNSRKEVVFDADLRHNHCLIPQPSSIYLLHREMFLPSI